MQPIKDLTISAISARLSYCAKSNHYRNKYEVVFAACGRSGAFAAAQSGEWAGMTRPVAAAAPPAPPRLDAGPSAAIFISMMISAASRRRPGGHGGRSRYLVRHP